MHSLKKLVSTAAGVLVIVAAVVFNLLGCAPSDTSPNSQIDPPAAAFVDGSESPDDLTPVKSTSRSQSSKESKSSSKASSSKATSGSAPKESASDDDEDAVTVTEDGTYTSKDEVAAYIHEFGHLPSNFISKTKARKAGWESSKGNLDEVCPGKSIGGSVFYNDEGSLPDAEGREWHECDINYSGGFRGRERIVFSNDGLIYYTGDHYKTFERLY